MTNQLEQKSIERYYSLDGVRAFASIGIVLLHVLANGNYDLNSSLAEKTISSFSGLVFFFMMISSFSLCCGYYDKFMNNTISLSKFYTKRYTRIWPFFALLVLIDVVISPSREAIFEAFADLTLCFGLLPNNNIRVIGVGWTLGVIFLFYMLFPFFCFLICSKKRAWFAFIITLLLNYICNEYFITGKFVLSSFSSRTNILYCAMYFIAGGMLYLYRDQIKKGLTQHKSITLFTCLILTVVYVCVISKNNHNTLANIVTLITFSGWFMYVICSEGVLLCNPVTRFISKISFEIYLSHMVLYRVLERLHMLNLFSNDILSYICTFVIVLAFTICFVVCVKRGYKILAKLLKKEHSIS